MFLLVLFSVFLVYRYDGEVSFSSNVENTAGFIPGFFSRAFGIMSSSASSVRSFSSALYMANASLVVNISVTSTDSFIVDECYPASWTFVSGGDNHFSSGCPSNNALPFISWNLNPAGSKNLSYTVRSPVGAGGTANFEGTLSYGLSSVAVGGLTSINFAVPINGTCGALTQNNCTAGLLNDIADNSTSYLWQCNGLYLGTNSSCSLNIPVNGTCGATQNNCTLGTLNNPTTNSSSYLWQCLGLYNGQNASCSSIKPSYLVNVTISGNGTVTSNPTGINCGATCFGTFYNGTSVVLNATPSSGSLFSNWTGCDGGINNPCTIMITSARNVKATFISFHPTDINRNWKINSTEVVRYDYCRINNATDPGNCSSYGFIPSSYVPNADYLRITLADGSYRYNSSLSCPACWISG